MSSLAFETFASSIAWATASPAVSEPSVPTTMRSNIPPPHPEPNFALILPRSWSGQLDDRDHHRSDQAEDDDDHHRDPEARHQSILAAAGLNPRRPGAGPGRGCP